MAVYPDLADKIVIITGGAGGLGLATAKAFYAQGSKIVLVDVSRDALDSAAKELGASQADLLTVVADVSKAEDVKNYVDQTVKKFGSIDVFVNNAGIEGKVAPIVDQAPDEFNRVIDINVRGTWLGMHFVLPVMYAQKRGSVINMSSIGGLVSGPMPVSPYVTSKFAITGMTRIVAHESAPYGVRVNSVHPSPAETRMMRSLESGSGANEKDIAKTIPMGRYASPQDVANQVLFLASEDSSFITGAQHVVDGGMTA